jgi:hypothetical protein
MSEDLSQTPEEQNIHLTKAQRLTSFAFKSFDSEINEDERRQAAEELNSGIMQFWAQSPNSSNENPDDRGDYSWTYFRSSPSDPVGRIRGSIVFDDNSELEVRINIKEAKDGVIPEYMAEVDLDAVFADEDPGTHPLMPLPEDYEFPKEKLTEESQYSQLWSIHYRIPNDGSRVLVYGDMSWGKERQYQDRLDELDWDFYDDDENERIYNIESALVKEGIDPDTNPEVAVHRANSEGYRIFSDYKREEFAKESFKSEMGHASTRDVGVDEVRKVISLFGITDEYS